MCDVLVSWCDVSSSSSLKMWSKRLQQWQGSNINVHYIISTLSSVDNIQWYIYVANNQRCQSIIWNGDGKQQPITNNRTVASIRLRIITISAYSRLSMGYILLTKEDDRSADVHLLIPNKTHDKDFITCFMPYTSFPINTNVEWTD